jgi:predicted HAD superfamily phosphohydrolase YqeG
MLWLLPEADVTGAVVAVDFDGTLVEHAYPYIGAEAFAWLIKLQAAGVHLILWTMRDGDNSRRRRRLLSGARRRVLGRERQPRAAVGVAGADLQ